MVCCSLSYLDAEFGAPLGSDGGDGSVEVEDDASAEAEVDVRGEGAVRDGDVTPGDPYGQAVLADMPVGWWRLEETEGATAKDSSGKGHNATIVGVAGIGFGAPGALASKRAFVFDGAASLVLGNIMDFEGPCTIEAWVKSSAADKNFRNIFSKIAISGSGPVEGFYFYYNGDLPRVGFEGWSSEVLLQLAKTDTRLDATTFTHLVLTHDGSIARLYWNGAIVASSGSAAKLKGTASPPTWGKGWSGALDELALYDKPLSGTRVEAHFRAAKPAGGS